MKRYLSGLLALILVVCISITGCAAAPQSTSGLTGNYRQDTLTVIDGLRTALQVPDDSPEKLPAQAQARSLISDFVSRYRRDTSLAKLPSFTTMRTALNSLAGHYSSYANRPVPQKMKDRLEQEFRQAEISLERGA